MSGREGLENGKTQQRKKRSKKLLPEKKKNERTSTQPPETVFESSLTESGTTAMRSRPASFHLFELREF